MFSPHRRPRLAGQSFRRGIKGRPRGAKARDQGTQRAGGQPGADPHSPRGPRPSWPSRHPAATHSPGSGSADGSLAWGLAGVEVGSLESSALQTGPAARGALGLVMWKISLGSIWGGGRRWVEPSIWRPAVSEDVAVHSMSGIEIRAPAGHSPPPGNWFQADFCRWDLEGQEKAPKALSGQVPLLGSRAGPESQSTSNSSPHSQS